MSSDSRQWAVLPPPASPPPTANLSPAERLRAITRWYTDHCSSEIVSGHIQRPYPEHFRFQPWGRFPTCPDPLRAGPAGRRTAEAGTRTRAERESTNALLTGLRPNFPRMLKNLLRF